MLVKDETKYCWLDGKIAGEPQDSIKDAIADFRKMPFDDESFYLVVFDPPHLLNVGDKSFLALKYGKLEKNMARGY